MTTLNDGLFAFYNDLLNQGLLNDTLVLQFSEFGRRINENGSQGTDHGAASVMMAMGGSVRGGIFGTAPNLRVRLGQSDAREQRQRRALRDGFPLGLREGDRFVARRRLGVESLGGNFTAGLPRDLSEGNRAPRREGER